MSDTVYDVNSPETRKEWSKKLSREAMKRAYVGKFIGTGKKALIQERKELKKNKGDRIRVTLRAQLRGAGKQGDATLKGNEESLETHVDDLYIDQLRHAADAGGEMSQQRILMNMRDECMDGLADWCSTRIDRWFFTQICGYTASGEVDEAGEIFDGADTRYTGNNATLAPSSNRHFFANDSVSTDQGLTSAHTLSLGLIDDLKAEAELASPLIKPIRYKGENLHVLFVHTRHEQQLRAEVGDRGWQNLQRALLEGGEGKDQNPIFQGGLGMYNRTILHSSSRITPGVHASSGVSLPNVRRAVMCGAQAAAIAFGGSSGFESWNWKEEEEDYGNQLGVAAGWIGGLKKCRFDGEDFGTMVLSTYADAVN